METKYKKFYEEQIGLNVQTKSALNSARKTWGFLSFER